MLEIRREVEADVTAISGLVEEAFAASDFGDHGESDLVTRLRDEDATALMLVATMGESLVGHITFSHVWTASAVNSRCGMGLGPVAVRPAVQRQGIGSALIRHGLDQLEASGGRFVVVLGDPAFYRRFGFQLAPSFNARHGFAGIPQEFFQVKGFTTDAIAQLEGQTVYFHSAFGPQA